MIHVDGPHPATIEMEVLLAQCAMGLGRGSGPGGQHRNKVQTRVELSHTPTGIKASAGERRSVRENKPMAIRRLRLELAMRVRCVVPDGEVQSELWKSRVKDGKIICSEKHHDYAALLAEAMDVLYACGLEPGLASARLCCSSSQLIKLIKKHSPALEMINQARHDKGMHRLK